MVALVLLPGMDGTGELFAPFISALDSQFPVTIVRYPENEALDYAALEIVARAAVPSSSPFVLLGESFSGPIAISLASSAPAGLVGLILCCSFARNPRPWLSVARFVLQLLPVKQVPLSLLARSLLGHFSNQAQRGALAAALAQVPASVLRARLRAVLESDASAALARIKVPVLYLRAAYDRIVPRSASELVLRLLPKTKLVELDGPHFLLQAAPVEATRIVGAFMREVA